MKVKLILYAVTIPICWRNCIANNHPHYHSLFRGRNIFTVQFLNCHIQHKDWFLRRVTLSKVNSSGEEIYITFHARNVLWDQPPNLFKKSTFILVYTTFAHRKNNED